MCASPEASLTNDINVYQALILNKTDKRSFENMCQCKYRPALVSFNSTLTGKVLSSSLHTQPYWIPHRNCHLYNCAVRKSSNHCQCLQVVNGRLGSHVDACARTQRVAPREPHAAHTAELEFSLGMPFMCVCNVRTGSNQCQCLHIDIGRHCRQVG